MMQKCSFVPENSQYKRPTFLGHKEGQFFWMEGVLLQWDKLVVFWVKPRVRHLTFGWGTACISYNVNTIEVSLCVTLFSRIRFEKCGSQNTPLDPSIMSAIKNIYLHLVSLESLHKGPWLPNHSLFGLTSHLNLQQHRNQSRSLCPTDVQDQLEFHHLENHTEISS